MKNGIILALAMLGASVAQPAETLAPPDDELFEWRIVGGEHRRYPSYARALKAAKLAMQIASKEGATIEQAMAVAERVLATAGWDSFGNRIKPLPPATLRRSCDAECDAVVAERDALKAELAEAEEEADEARRQADEARRQADEARRQAPDCAALRP